MDIAPYIRVLRKPVSILVLLSGRGVIIWGYLHALLHPAQSISFIYYTAFLIFILELLNIGFTAIISAEATSMSLALQAFLLSQLAIWVTLLLMLFQQKTAILYFAASVLARMAFRSGPGNSGSWGCAVMLLLFVAFTVTLTASFWSSLFPFPQIVYDKTPVNVSGGWVDHPQVILIWGIAFFGLMALMEALQTLTSPGPAKAARVETKPSL